MDHKESVMKGGVLIVHQVSEGKHEYQVENVMKSRKGEKMFVRRGDKLMQINGTDLQDLTPEELADMLAEGNPQLTVHKAEVMKEHTWRPPQAEDTIHPVSKETTVLSFCMEMKREEDLTENEEGQEGVDQGCGGSEEEVNNGEKWEGGDMLVVSMAKTTISVVKGRGCDMSSPCGGCGGTGCTFDDVVLVSESSKVVLVARGGGGGGGGGFKQEKQANYAIRHAASHQYLRGLCSQNSVYTSPNPEKITIYSYKSTYFNWFSKGKPVVLNFTGSNCFLRCCKEGERVLLRAEMCEKQRLKHISKSDESTLSFVFFMKPDSPHQKFESALHRGWFIQIVNSQSVAMAQRDGGSEDHLFLFIIQK
ncbi:interleukin-1 family member A isoform X2 [Notolabrus celidotus]|uniref:interleukin-1 family member A isoform X2 n=1 Tax=Notolabrus celidotus TaxID=1203425 RepID=UPI0014901A68|nr:interleukin-1 family member A isoform X2 [Notolabrus celidotus]